MDFGLSHRERRLIMRFSFISKSEAKYDILIDGTRYQQAILSFGFPSHEY